MSRQNSSFFHSRRKPGNKRAAFLMVTRPTLPSIKRCRTPHSREMATSPQPKINPPAAQSVTPASTPRTADSSTCFLEFAHPCSLIVTFNKVVPQQIWEPNYSRVGLEFLPYKIAKMRRFPQISCISAFEIERSMLLAIAMATEMEMEMQDARYKTEM